MSMRKRTSPAAARRRPAALFLLVDVLAAALLVFGNYFFLYIAPMQGLGGASMSLPQVQNNLQPSAHQQVTEITGSAPEQTQPLSLREKFAEHFTDTVVSTGTSYSSPDLSVEVTQHTFGRRSDAVTYLWRISTWRICVLFRPNLPAENMMPTGSGSTWMP